jgi:HK97 family phage portal protein
MSFWSNATRWARKNATPDWGVLERYLAWAFGGGASAAGIIVNPQTAMQSAAVYSCIKVLAESVAMLPCNLYRKGANNAMDQAEDHPLWPLLHDQPNDYQSSVEFFEMLVMHLCLRGNHYAYVNRTRSGRVVELLPLHPDVVRTEMSSNFELRYQVTMPDGSFKDFAPGELLHVRGQTLNGWLGISPIAYAREAIGLSLATEKFGGQLFRNGAKMGGVLQHPGKIGDEAYKRLKSTFDEAHSGENAHKTAILEEGMKYEKVTMTGEDAQFLETRKYQRSEIAAIFRIPPHMIGDLEKATFSNIEQQSLEFVTLSLMPWLNRIEKAIKRDLFTPDDKKTLRTRFNASLLLRGDAKARGLLYQQGISSGWLTRNEARAMESELGVILNPLDGLDEPLQPLNMAPAGEQPDASEPNADDNEPGESTKALIASIGALVAAQKGGTNVINLPEKLRHEVRHRVESLEGLTEEIRRSTKAVNDTIDAQLESADRVEKAVAEAARLYKLPRVMQYDRHGNPTRSVVEE